jgi:hypothetical protein
MDYENRSMKGPSDSLRRRTARRNYIKALISIVSRILCLVPRVQYKSFT